MAAPDSPPTPVVVTEDRIRDLVTEADALASARAAFEAMGTEGAVQQPPPMGYDLPDEVEIHVKGAALAGALCADQATRATRAAGERRRATARLTRPPTARAVRGARACEAALRTVRWFVCPRRAAATGAARLVGRRRRL